MGAERPHQVASQQLVGVPVEQRAPDRFFQGRGDAGERPLLPRHAVFPRTRSAR